MHRDGPPRRPKMSKHLGNTVELKRDARARSAPTRCASRCSTRPRRRTTSTGPTSRSGTAPSSLEQLWELGAARGCARWPELDAELRERIDGGDETAAQARDVVRHGARNVTRALDAIEMKHAVEGVIALFGEAARVRAQRLTRPGRTAGARTRSTTAALRSRCGSSSSCVAPMAPHLAEELWALCGERTLLATLPWPEPVARTSRAAAAVAAPTLRPSACRHDRLARLFNRGPGVGSRRCRAPKHAGAPRRAPRLFNGNPRRILPCPAS